MLVSNRQLNLRGYSNRSSVVSYKTELNYKPTYPPEDYPPAAPYAGLTKYLHNKVKDKAITDKLLRQLLYSEYLNKMNLNLVKIRHHKSEIVIMTRDSHCRDSIINCDSESDSDSDDSDDGNIKRQNAMDDSDSGSSGSSSNPFGYIRYYNPQTGSEREENLRYESFLDYGEPVANTSGVLVVLEDEPKKKSVVMTSTATVQLVKQNSETSEASSCFASKPNLACIDIPNLDDNTQMNESLTVPQNYVPSTRQSCPTKFVGNKFNQSSLTTIYIPSWSNSDNNISCQTKPELSEHRESSSTTTHSSSLELPVNTVPLPDNMVAELLYNFDGHDFLKSDSQDSDVTEVSSTTVIKPPKMFSNAKKDGTSQTISLDLKNVGFRKHSINSDKPKRRSSIQINPEDLSKDNSNNKKSDIRRCVSSQFLKMSDPAARQSYCRCCMEACHSPRSSDSGMAGSCTLNSPDLANAAELSSMQERCSMDMSHLFQKYNDLTQFGGDSSRNVISLSEIEARDFESQCPCTSPFGSTPRTSCQPYTSENILTGSHESLRTSVTSSIDIQPRIHSTEIKLDPRPNPKCIEEWEAKPADGSAAVSQDVDELVAVEEETPVYRSGLYAHWWLKAKIPSSVLRGIYEGTRSPTTGKGMFFG